MAGAALGENQFGFPVEAVIVGPIVVTPTPNRSAVTFRTVTVTTAGTPVQGPTVTVPDGFAVLVRIRSQAGTPIIFLANSLANTAVSTLRSELEKGDAIPFKIDDMDLLFFDSDLNGAIAELIAEQ